MSRQQICQVCECGEKSCKDCTKQEECRDCNTEGSCCCASTHVVWHKEQVRRGLFLEYFSLGWMSVEVIASIIAGLIVGKSFALLAFGGDSLVELNLCLRGIELPQEFEQRDIPERS